MTINNQKYNALSLFVLLVTVVSTPALAYQFGPPAITELAESGASQNRLSLYSQATEYDGSLLKPTLRGISFASSAGDSSGATSGMFRLAQYTDNRKVDGAASDSTGLLIGGGVGKQWYFGAARNFGVLLNGQMDYLNFSYDANLIPSGTATLVNSQLALGVEAGVLYRIFISTATITPFYTMTAGKRNRKRTTTTSSCTNCDADFSYSDSATTVGIDFMMGKLSATILQTKASYDGSSQTATFPTQKSTITMFVLGVNY